MKFCTMKDFEVDIFKRFWDFHKPRIALKDISETKRRNKRYLNLTSNLEIELRRSLGGPYSLYNIYRKNRLSDTFGWKERL